MHSSLTSRQTSVQPAIRWFRECFFVPHSSLRKTRAAAQAAPKMDATIDGDWIFCSLLFRSSHGVAEMKGIAAQLGWFGAGFFCLVTVGWVLASPQGKPLLKGLPLDWTQRHVILPQPARAEQARLLANEPGQQVLDTLFQIQTIRVGGTSRATTPPWSLVVGATTADNAVRWLNQGRQVVVHNTGLPAQSSICGHRQLGR